MIAVGKMLFFYLRFGTDHIIFHGELAFVIKYAMAIFLNDYFAPTSASQKVTLFGSSF